MSTIRLQYLFDPLCGWCYASAPALAGLARNYPALLELHPSGLFAGPGARDLTAEFANYAWANDQRIAAMTGQVFSAAYHRQVLEHGGRRFDSGAMNRALTAVHAIDRTLEAGLLHCLQQARYVDGADTAAAETVAILTADYLRAHGHGDAAAAHAPALTHALTDDAMLAQQTQARIAASQGLMAQLGIEGVPQLLVRVDDSVLPLRSGALYGGADQLVAELRRVLGEQLPGPR